MSDVTLLTITGDRHKLFSLCEMYMRRQTIFDACRWVVVDDGVQPTECSAEQSYIRLPPEADSRVSFRRNMLVGLAAVTTPKVVIIEDDDCYSDRWYVERQATVLDWKLLSGTTRAKYYHVGRRCWRIHPNNQHASLSSTAFRGDKIKRLMVDYLEGNPRPETLDGGIWKRSGVKPDEKSIIPCSTVIGIKGGPGRGGLGIDHTGELKEYTPDLHLVQLRKWVGDDVEFYADFYTPSEVVE